MNENISPREESQRGRKGGRSEPGWQCAPDLRVGQAAAATGEIVQGGVFMGNTEEGVFRDERAGQGVQYAAQ